MTPRAFVEQLAGIALPCVFNPYADRCPEHDLADAPARRRRNLTRYLERARACGAASLWVARDLGYRGGRRTGIAMTDELHLASANRLFGGMILERATRGAAVAERTAAMVWKVIEAVNRPIVLWNVFPLHPHEANEPMSNRCHTRAERETTMPLFQALLELLQPRDIIAIGRDAAVGLEAIKLPTVSVRHPSYGGQSEFVSGLHTFYQVPPAPPLELPDAHH
jgi:hypothetical protein